MADKMADKNKFTSVKILEGEFYSQGLFLVGVPKEQHYSNWWYSLSE